MSRNEPVFGESLTQNHLEPVPFEISARARELCLPVGRIAYSALPDAEEFPEMLELAALTSYMKNIKRKGQSPKLSAIHDSFMFIGSERLASGIGQIATQMTKLLDEGHALEFVTSDQSDQFKNRKPSSIHSIGSSWWITENVLLSMFTPSRVEELSRDGYLTSSKIGRSWDPSRQYPLKVMVDDWSISSQQALSTANYGIRCFFVASTNYAKSKLASKTGQQPFVVFSPDSDESIDLGYGASISGSHASVDYGFRELLPELISARAADFFAKIHPGSSFAKRSRRVPLTDIVPPYRRDSYTPRLVINREGVIIANS